VVDEKGERHFRNPRGNRLDDEEKLSKTDKPILRERCKKKRKNRARRQAEEIVEGKREKERVE